VNERGKHYETRKNKKKEIRNKKAAKANQGVSQDEVLESRGLGKKRMPFCNGRDRTYVQDKSLLTYHKIE
jgi:hypothetical protein